MLKVKECDIMINQSKFILKLNLLITQNGFSAVKNIGIIFRKKINIIMEEIESHD